MKHLFHCLGTLCCYLQALFQILSVRKASGPPQALQGPAAGAGGHCWTAQNRVEPACRAVSGSLGQNRQMQPFVDDLHAPRFFLSGEISFSSLIPLAPQLAPVEQGRQHRSTTS